MTTNEERAARDKCLVRFLATPLPKPHYEREIGDCGDPKCRVCARRAKRRKAITNALEIAAGAFCAIAAGAFCAAFVLWCAWGLMIAFSR